MTTAEVQDLVDRLLIRARIRRQAKGRKSVEEGKPDRISDLLEEAAEAIRRLHEARTPKTPRVPEGPRGEFA